MQIVWLPILCFSNVLGRYPVLSRELIYFGKTEQLPTRKKQMHSDYTPFIASWTSPAGDSEFLLRSRGRDFLLIARLAPPHSHQHCIIHEEEEVNTTRISLWGRGPVILLLLLIFPINILSWKNKQKTACTVIICRLEDEHLRVKCYFLWKTCTLSYAYILFIDWAQYSESASPFTICSVIPLPSNQLKNNMHTQKPRHYFHWEMAVLMTFLNEGCISWISYRTKRPPFYSQGVVEPFLRFISQNSCQLISWEQRLIKIYFSFTKQINRNILV